MPRGDGTGPMGSGPMTGRAAGFCAGYATPGYMNPVGGRGFGFGLGRGRGFGRGWGRGFGRGFGPVGFGGYAPAAGVAPYSVNPGAQWTRQQELEMLKNQAEGTRSALEEIQKRIEELEAAKE